MNSDPIFNVIDGPHLCCFGVATVSPCEKEATWQSVRSPALGWCDDHANSFSSGAVIPIGAQRALQLRLVGELRGTRCQCGQDKGPCKTVCTACWKRLPRTLRRNLYRGIGRGYEEAYQAAIDHLNGKEAGDGSC